MACRAAIAAVERFMKRHRDGMMFQSIVDEIHWWHRDTIKEALDSLAAEGVLKATSTGWYYVPDLAR